jgi:signal transduction histidine kinase
MTVELFPPQAPTSVWIPRVLLLQLTMVAIFSWFAVRLATRPLMQLAQAADSLGPGQEGELLPEDGPQEVARAASAFNAMQRRIADQLAERMQILAAVSHDLQTPITRMRLRADLLDNTTLRDKLHGDLNAMQVLVEEGIAYARSAESPTEALCRTDLNALLDSLVCDYVDAGRSVRLGGHCAEPISTRPHTLRRIITNLVDNALKFAGDAEITVEDDASDRVCIFVRDRGPGIPEAELQAVLRPFYRVEASRNRETGGTGLGLAIALQLTRALGGTLAVSNREGGGLEAWISLPVAAAQRR